MKQETGSFKITVLITTKINVKYMRKEFATKLFQNPGTVK